MIGAWKNLPRTSQNLAIAMFILLLALAFFGVEAPRVDKKMRAVAAQISMREKRKQAPPPTAPVAQAGDPKKLAEEKRQLDQQVAGLAAKVQEREGRLAPLGEPAVQQRLQLALAKLAQDSDVEMESFKLIDESRRDEHLAPTVERLRTVLNNEFKRPLYLFNARASYRGLMQVLDGLAALEYAIVPVDLSVQVRVELAPKKEGEAERRLLRQWLDVQMILAF